jgi:hypothetical protein
MERVRGNRISWLGTAVGVLAALLTFCSVSRAQVSSISANFTGIPIAGGSYIWFSSVLKLSGSPSRAVTIYARNGTIQFTANGSTYTVVVPDANVTFDPAATTATTSFSTVNNSWNTRVPATGLAGDTFLSAAAYLVPAGGLPGGIHGVTWQCTFLADAPGVGLQWQWGGAVYPSFSTDYNALGVKPVDDNKASQYQNPDHAGTPENYKIQVVGGATGGGGSNYTGGNSAKTSVGTTTDTTAPQIAVAAPLPGGFVNSATPHIVVTYSDAAGASELAATGVNPSSLTVTLDGSDITSLFIERSADASADIPASRSMAAGLHSLQASVKDYAGNTATASAQFTVDLVAPQIQVVQPASGAYVNTATPTISVQYSDNAALNLSSLRILVNNTDLTSLFNKTSSGATATLTAATALPQGANQIVASIKDQAGNPGSASVAFNVDLTRPVISFVQPAPGSYSGSPVNIAVQYSDDQAIDTATLQVALDGTPVTMTQTPTGATGTAAGAANGPHTLSAAISDRAGNQGTATDAFQVDATAPNIRLVQPAPGALLTDASPQVSIEYSDSDGVDTSTLQVLINGTDQTSLFTVGPASATAQLAGRLVLPQGQTTITALIKDLVLNQGSSGPVSVTVDTVAPSVSFQSPPAQTNSNAPTAAFSYSDATSGVNLQSVRVSVDGTDVTSLIALGESTATGVLRMTPALGEGQHQLQATLADRAGNQATPPAWPFFVDTVPPAAVFTLPANNSFLNNATPSILLQYNDGTGTGIDPASVQIYLQQGTNAPADVTSYFQVGEQQATGSIPGPAALRDGTYKLSAVVGDRVGNVGPAQATFELDTVPPAYGVVAPAPNAYVNTVTPSVQIAYQDDRSGIDTSKLALLIDGIDRTTALTITPTGATGTLPALAEGQHTVQVTVVDRAGNNALPPAVPQTFTVATVPPSITYAVTPPPNAAGWNRSDATVTFTCAPGTAPLVSCTGPQMVSIEGANQQVTGTVTDAAGYSVSVAAGISLDRTPPALTIASPANGATVASSSLTVSGSVSDNLSGVATATCNGAAAVVQNGSFSCAVTLASGANQVQVNAADRAGNGASVTLSVTFAVPAPAITNLSPASGPPGTLVTITGTNFGATQGSSTVTFDGVSVTVASWTATQIVVTVPIGAASGNFLVTVGGQASNPALFTVAVPPQITSLSPTWGPAGTVVTITGTNFGATQGTSTVTFNGVPASPITWTATQITVAAPSGATSGPVVVTVGGLASNGMQYNLGQPPAITASVWPAPNAAGWNNWTATVSFTCTAASAPVQSCPAPIVVTTEGIGQVATGTARDANGNTGQVSVTLNIDKTRPAIAVTSPQEGATVSAGSVTISGTVSDSLSGLVGGVTCNGAPATVTGSNFTCSATLELGGNLVSVRAADAAGNASLFRLRLKVPIPPSTIANTVSVAPSYATLTSGDVRWFTAVDELGRQRPDAHWSVSDPTILAPTTDPISGDTYFTAAAAGTATVSASVGIAIGQAQVTVIAGGTPAAAPGRSTTRSLHEQMPVMTAGEIPAVSIRWSLPALSEYDVLLKAQPLDGGPDLLAVHYADSSTLLTGLTSDGTPLWKAEVNVPSAYDPVPDGFGGALVNKMASAGGSESYTFIEIDGQTGKQVWRYDTSGDSSLQGPVAIGPDGTIYVVDRFWPPGDPVPAMRLVVLDGDTGLARFAYTFPFGTEVRTSGTRRLTPWIAPPVIGPDGTVFAPVAAQNYNTITGSYGNQLSLVRLQPDGSVTVSAFKTITTDSAVQVSPSAIIPDGEGGAFVSWYVYGPWWGYEPHLTHVTATGATDRVIAGDIEQMVLGENGVIFVSDRATVTACRTDTLATLWSYPRSTGDLYLVVATADGGVIVNDGGATVPLDSTGARGSTYADGTPWAGSDWIDVIPSGASGAAASWQPLSTSHRRSTRRRDLLPRSSAGPMNAGTTFAYAVFTSFVANAASTVWAWPGGDGDSQRSGEWFPALPSCPAAQTPCAQEVQNAALKSLRSVMLNLCPACFTYVFSKFNRPDSNQQQFYQYLARPPRFFDGSRSTAPMNRLCGPGWWDRWTCAYGTTPAAQFMKARGASAISETPSEPNKGMMVFFNEVKYDPATEPYCPCSRPTQTTSLDPATIFHEALHGYFGFQDFNFIAAFYNTSEGFPSACVTYYIADRVLNGGGSCTP